MSIVAGVGALAQSVAEEFNSLRSEVVTVNTVGGSIASVAGGLDGALAGSLQAAAGQAVRGVHYIQAPLSNVTDCYIACIRPGLLFINGAYIKSMAAQEVHTYNAEVGDTVQVVNGSCFPIYKSANSVPYEANNASQAGKIFFWNRFRGTSSRESISALLPIDTSVKIWGPNPTFVDGVVQGTPQHDTTVPSSQTIDLLTVGTGIYYMEAEFEVLLTTTNGNGTQDPRTVPPPSKNIIGTFRAGGGLNFSALDPQTSEWVNRRGRTTSVDFTAGQSKRMDDTNVVGSAWTTGITTTDLHADATFISYGGGRGVQNAGADTAGVNAYQGQVLENAANVFVTPIDIEVRGSTNDQCVIQSRYECEAYVFDPDGSYRGKIDVRRGSEAPTPATKESQIIPAAANFRPNLGIFTGQGTLPRGTMFILNMPGFMVCNFGQVADAIARDDETPVFGDTVHEYLCPRRIIPITGVLQREVFDDVTGQPAWVDA